MFEALKSFRQEPTEECEECLTKDFLVDAIVDGKQKRICQRCVISNNAIVLKKPSPIQQETINKPSVREAMFRASGIMPKPLSAPMPIKLEDLRARYEEIKKKKEQQTSQILGQPIDEKKESKIEILDEKEFIKHIGKLPKEEEKEKPEEKKEESAKVKSKEEVLDFSPEATRRTRIRDLLEKMKKMDEEIEAREKTKEAEKIAEAIKAKKEAIEEKPLEEVHFEETDI